MRLCPLSWRTWLYYHHYRARRPQLRSLFEGAELAFAPGVRMRLVPTDEGHGCIATAGFYELPLTRTIARLGKNGGVLVDVGANYGYISLLWAAQKAGNRVIAFEASPRNQQALRLNVERNGFTDAIALRNEAAGKEVGELKFHLGPEEQTGWGGLVQGDANGDEATVRVVTLDEELKDIQCIDVLKIDTEGADTWVLEGATFSSRKTKAVWPSWELALAALVRYWRATGIRSLRLAIRQQNTSLRPWCPRPFNLLI